MYIYSIEKALYARERQINLAALRPTFLETSRLARKFEIFALAAPSGAWIIFIFLPFEEWTNQRIHRGTNIIFEKHLEAIWFAAKHIKI